jgi:hypothetical protein
MNEESHEKIKEYDLVKIVEKKGQPILNIFGYPFFKQVIMQSTYLLFF